VLCTVDYVPIGGMYYEGKEFEIKLRQKMPGEYSDELMRALGMNAGKLSPHPWLYTQQR
jgi:splicing factor 3B subunit 2